MSALDGLLDEHLLVILWQELHFVPMCRAREVNRYSIPPRMLAGLEVTLCEGPWLQRGRGRELFGIGRPHGAA